MEISCKEFLSEVQEELKASGIQEESDAEWIFCKVLGTRRSSLPFFGEIKESQIEEIRKMVSARKKHIPLDYIFGESEFLGFKLKVNENCLIPRIDTEIVAEEVIKFVKSLDGKCSVLDIGTGSGAIAIAVAKETNADVTAVDVSQEAIKLAKGNAEANGVKIRFLKSNLFENLVDEKFDVIVSNPPYIETDVINTLEPEVKDHEPRLALDGGADGLMFYRKIVSEAPKHLKAQGKIFFEIGYNQKESVSKLLEKDFEDIDCIKDYGGNDRVIFGTIKERL